MEIRAEQAFAKSEWVALVEANEFIVPIHEYENSNIKSYGYAILKVEGTVYGLLNWDWEHGKITVDVREKYLSHVHAAITQIAKDIGGSFYYRKNEPFNPQKHLPIPAITIDRAEPYFADSELEELRWMALRSTSQEAVLQALGLSKQREGRLEDLLREEGYVLSPAYEGWVFIMGDTLPELLLRGDEQSSQEALDRMCKSLQQLSRTFGAAQYFEYSDKSSVSGYFSASNGKLIYGYWQSELETFSKGRLPKAIKHLHPANPHEIAAVWSIDPLDFVYLALFAEGGAVLAGLAGGERQ